MIADRMSAPPAPPRRRAARLRRFAAAEEGTVTIFACFMILMMLMVGGIGVDLMRHEMERTRIQAVSDRAVLAAADLDQTRDARDVVYDYFAKSGMAGYVANVTVDQGLNYKTVTVDATTSMNTQFMDDLGVPKLSIPAIAAAEEKVNKVEISLVLDISGSMRSNGKMANLRDAAGVFIDTVIKKGNEDLISINVVPYTAQVNAGQPIFDQLNIVDKHAYSYCVDFETADFDETTISTTKSYEHMQHFDAGYYWNGRDDRQDTIDNPGCPKRSYEQITAFSQNATALKGQIDQFQPRANTSIHIGMKWGVAMLDPSFRPINSTLASAGQSDPVFANRPAAYGDSDTLKTVVLMTDGQNVHTMRINNNYYQTDRRHHEHWSKYPLNWYLRNYVRSEDHPKWRYYKYYSWQADAMLDSICNAAKANRIVIWSIGFEVNDRGADVMRSCASSPSHFFRVEGVEIKDAFSAIARQINQLRLTL